MRPLLGGMPRGGCDSILLLGSARRFVFRLALRIAIFEVIDRCTVVCALNLAPTQRIGRLCRVKSCVRLRTCNGINWLVARLADRSTKRSNEHAGFVLRLDEFLVWIRIGHDAASNTIVQRA